MLAVVFYTCFKSELLTFNYTVFTNFVPLFYKLCVFLISYKIRAVERRGQTTNVQQENKNITECGC